MKLKTSRLTVRGLADNDFEALFRLTGDADSMQYVGDGLPITADATRRWIAVSQANYADHDYGAFAVVDNASGQFAGYAGFVHSADVSPPAEAELIYALLPEFRGRGLASELAAALVTHGFETFGFTRILATVDPANTASIRILEKSGFILHDTQPDEHGLETAFFWRERGR